MTAATARLVELLDAEVQTTQVEGDGYVVVMVVPGVHPNEQQAEMAADEIHAALQRALSADLGPLLVSAERLPATTAAAAPSAPTTPEEIR